MLFTPTPKFATIRTRRPSVPRRSASTGSVTARKKAVRLAHRRGELGAAKAAVLGVEHGVELGGEPRLDGLGELAGDDDPGPCHQCILAPSGTSRSGAISTTAPLGVGDAEGQHLGAERPDLARREVDDGEHQAPDQRLGRVVRGDLRRGLLLADLRAEVDPELDRRLARLGEGLGAGHPADADVDLEKIVEGDLGPCLSPAPCRAP